MRDGFDEFGDLPVATVLGPEFETAENQRWLAAWAEKWMDLSSTASKGWGTDGSKTIGDYLLWEPAASDLSSSPN